MRQVSKSNLYVPSKMKSSGALLRSAPALSRVTLSFLLLVIPSVAFYETRCCYDSDGVKLENCVCLKNNAQTKPYELQEGKELKRANRDNMLI